MQELQNNTILITAEHLLSIHPADRFLFQVQGLTADAYFIATSTGVPVSRAPYIQGSTAEQVVELPALNYDFQLITPIQMRDAQQQARKLISAISARMSTRGRSSELLITDASAGGMGVIAWEELENGDVVGVDVRHEGLQESFNCEVRHCRPEPRLIGAYRIGLQFQKPNRLALTAWRKLINPL